MTDSEFDDFINIPPSGATILAPPEPVVVDLTDDDMALGEAIGRERQSESEKKNLRDAYGFDGKDGVLKHIDGARGEIAAARACGLPFESRVNTFKAPDLGRIYAVRTRSRDDYDLIVRADDSAEKVYILVTQAGGKRFKVWGWIMGFDARRDRWLKDYGNRPSAWFVPKVALKSISSLPADE